MNASNPDSGKDQTGKPASREMPFQGSLLSRLNSLGGAIACGLVALNFLGGCLMVVCAPARSTSDYLKGVRDGLLSYTHPAFLFAFIILCGFSSIVATILLVRSALTGRPTFAQSLARSCLAGGVLTSLFYGFLCLWKLGL